MSPEIWIELAASFLNASALVISALIQRRKEDK